MRSVIEATDVEVRLLTPDDARLLLRVAPDVFDHEVDPTLAAEFLGDGRHHLAVAIEGDCVVGMASALHYVHPDKSPQLWINEVGVAGSHRQRGIGKRLLDCLMRVAEEMGCTEAWVLTARDNSAGRRLYEAAGADLPAEECLMYTIRLPRPG
ncbi:MAG TPA: GNAT family N-acetyltransferase [Gemmatimonadaceae bacterium]|nr:GNAT family N-acetyltransferase [Gemmatimonadaceae bacterium]